MKIARLQAGPEIFFTIQGEGRNVGRPSIFIRASQCNLHCRWCDTDYTWNWQGTRFLHKKDEQPGYTKYTKEEQIVEMATTAIADMVQQWPCSHFVLTGGEPLMQQPDWVELLRELRLRIPSASFEVETNGTLIPDADLDALIEQYNVSPKLANSGNPARLREKPEALRWFAASEKAFFKFVVATPDDLAEVQRLVDTYHLDPGRTWLMPEGTTQAQLLEKRLWLIEICKTHGFRFGDRLHIHVWGDKRGV